MLQGIIVAKGLDGNDSVSVKTEIESNLLVFDFQNAPESSDSFGIKETIKSQLSCSGISSGKLSDLPRMSLDEALQMMDSLKALQGINTVSRPASGPWNIIPDKLFEESNCDACAGHVHFEPQPIAAVVGNSLSWILVNSPACYGACADGTSWDPKDLGGCTDCELHMDKMCPGDYVIFAFDAAFNSDTITFNIHQKDEPIIFFNVTHPSCPGASDGVINANITGQDDFNYSFTPIGGSGTLINNPDVATASGLPQGWYYIQVIDVKGCVVTDSVQLIDPIPLTVNMATNANAVCFGTNTGQVSATPGGGWGGYTFNWSNGNNVPVNPNLVAGIYTVTVTDAGGCTISATATVSQPTPITLSLTKTDIDCNGNGNGTITSKTGGGAGGYTWFWLPYGGADSAATNLGAGVFTVTVLDANLCTQTASITILEPSPLSFANVTSSNVTCKGFADGSASVLPTGGAPPYTYNWTPYGGTNAIALNLGPGVFQCIITDANGCNIGSPLINITEPASALTTIISSKTDVSCFNGSDGNATVFPIGGVGPYTYLWSPIGGTGATATNLPAGTFYVLVTDAGGCQVLDSVTINQPGAGLTSAISSSTNVTCNGGSNGSATGFAVGGVPGYFYSWSPSGGFLPTATNLSAGLYTFQVTDLRGCTTSAQVNITEPPIPLVANMFQTNVLCFGDSTGTGTIVPTGGTAPYTYQWSPGGQTTPTASSLPAGPFVATVTDAQGCTASGAINIVQLAPLANNTIVVEPLTGCNVCEGEAYINVLGGAAPFTYNVFPATGNVFWDVTGTQLNMLDLCYGTYYITITDANGCRGYNFCYIIS